MVAGLDAILALRSEKTFAILPLHLTAHLTGHIIAVWISKDALAKSLGWLIRRVGLSEAKKTARCKNLFREAMLKAILYTGQRSGKRLGMRSCSATHFACGAWLAAELRSQPMQTTSSQPHV